MTSNVRRNLAVQLTAGGASPLVLKAKGVLPFRVGTAVNMALIAKGGTAPYAYSITGGALPTAATFTASISTATMTVTAVANGTIYIGMPVKGTGVAAGQTVISFGTGTGGTGTYGVGISNTLTSRAMTGTLLLAAATGLITGTPSVAGAYTFTAQVQDATATVFTGSFEMPISHVLTITQGGGSPRNTSFADGYAYQLGVTGNTGALTFALTSGALPSGLSVSSSGLISGTTTSFASSTPFTGVITASDAGSGDSITIPFSIVSYVAPTVTITPPLTAATLNFYRLNEGTSYAFVNTVTRIAPYSQEGLIAGWTVTSSLNSLGAQPLPSWVTVSKNGAVATLTIAPPVGSGTAGWQFTFRANGSDPYDGATNSSTQTAVITVAQASIQPKSSGVAVGSPTITTIDFAGLGAASVANDNTTTTVTLGANMNAPAVNVTIPANSSAVVARKITIASGKKITIGSGGILRIL